MTKNSPNIKRTQAERRNSSKQAVLSSALTLFGQRGYADTSIEDIAKDCGLTITPIYHYFGNKKALFAAVVAELEQRIVDSMGGESIDSQLDSFISHWRAFLDLCEDPGFRRIVLVDSPNILGRERWADSEVSRNARALMTEGQHQDLGARYRQALFARIIMAAFTEAALMIAVAEDSRAARIEAEALIADLFSGQAI
jgi:AcrR family transcriptional regulator